MNKRGNILDGILILGIIFTMAMVAVIVGVVINVVATEFNADAGVPAEAKYIITHADNRFLPLMDFWAVLFLVGLPLISAILAYFNNIHPLFFWLSIIFVVLIVIFGAAYQELWQDLSEDTTLNTSVSSMPMTNFILSNFGFYSFFVFIIIALGTYAKLRSAGGFIE